MKVRTRLHAAVSSPPGTVATIERLVRDVSPETRNAGSTCNARRAGPTPGGGNRRQPWASRGGQVTVGRSSVSPTVPRGPCIRRHVDNGPGGGSLRRPVACRSPETQVCRRSTTSRRDQLARNRPTYRRTRLRPDSTGDRHAFPVPRPAARRLATRVVCETHVGRSTVVEPTPTNRIRWVMRRGSDPYRTVWVVRTSRTTPSEPTKKVTDAVRDTAV